MSVVNAMQMNTVNLVTSADNKYVRPLAVMLKSAERNLDAGWGLRVYILDGGISRWNRYKLEKGLDGQRVAVQWVSTKRQSQLDGVPVFGHVSVATYYRILIAELLPNVEKAIYLDADTVVLDDLSRLWCMDMDAMLIMAVQEGDLTVGSGQEVIPEYETLGIPPVTPLFNGGVFVADLKRWRTAQVSKRILEYLTRNHDQILYWDQDGLNAILWQNVKLLPKRWNYRVDCSHQGSGLASGEELGLIRQNASIVHYASATKPWDYYAIHPAQVLFYQYLDSTAWAGWRPRMPWRGFKNPHAWGRMIRGLPVAGNLWKVVRQRSRH